MVSQLSSRVLNFEANSHHEYRTRMTRVCGYIADKDSIHSSNTTCVKKQKRAKIVGMTAKKRKIDELHYQAATARSTLARSKKSYKRSLPGSPSKNMKAVELITVSKTIPYEEEIPTESLDVFDLSIYSQMIQSTKQFYSIGGLRSLSNDMKNGSPDHEGRIVRSSTNDSTTSLISSYSNSTKPFEIPARFEDYSQNKDTEDECEEIEISEKNILKDAILRSVICSSSLDKAFAAQSSAR